jgi:hypothetical protein
MPAQVRDGREQHTARATCRVIDALARLRLEHLGHQVDNGAVRVKLSSSVAGVVGEFFNEILVALAQLVLGQVGDGQLQRAKMLDQIAQHGIGEAVFVRPLGVAKDAVELVGVGDLDGAQGVLQDAAHIRSSLAHPAPVGL